MLVTANCKHARAGQSRAERKKWADMMAKVLEKVLDTLKGLADDRNVEIHSQAEVTR